MSVSSLSCPPTSKGHLHLPAGTNPARGCKEHFIHTTAECQAHFAMAEKNQITELCIITKKGSVGED